MKRTREEHTFDLTIEPGPGHPEGLKYENLYWEGEEPPDVVVLPDGRLAIKSGYYMSGKRNDCAYRIATVAMLLQDGRLLPAGDPAQPSHWIPSTRVWPKR